MKYHIVQKQDLIVLLQEFEKGEISQSMQMATQKEARYHEGKAAAYRELAAMISKDVIDISFE